MTLSSTCLGMPLYTQLYLPFLVPLQDTRSALLFDSSIVTTYSFLYSFVGLLDKLEHQRVSIFELFEALHKQASVYLKTLKTAADPSISQQDVVVQVRAFAYLCYWLHYKHKQ